MNVGRQYHTASILGNGKALVTGGTNGNSLNSAEIYDPIAGIWVITENMTVGRQYHTASVLENGKVLLTGGTNGSPLKSAELY
ncbi:unnamed protein product [Adineta steineri]|uniref:Uncharacterized protein n=1 Tax=Adineta steineri TaxID=433720 RepID=A0A820GVA7_9BILA|nr:unnamed protein product [Adineta steineri]